MSWPFIRIQIGIQLILWKDLQPWHLDLKQVVMTTLSWISFSTFRFFLHFGLKTFGFNYWKCLKNRSKTVGHPFVLKLQNSPSQFYYPNLDDASYQDRLALQGVSQKCWRRLPFRGHPSWPRNTRYRHREQKWGKKVAVGYKKNWGTQRTRSLLEL